MIKPMEKIKDKIGWPIFLTLCVMPIVFWLPIMPLQGRFNDWQTALTSVGQVFGLVGMAMFSLSLVLAARLKFIEPYFGGMNWVYNKHHYAGGVALILLLFHPLLLVAKLVPVDIVLAAKFFLPLVENGPTRGGIIALLLMIILLGLTFFAHLPYQIWKFSHKFLGLAFVFAGLHVLTISSDVSRSMPLRFYMAALILAGTASIIYRTILGSWLVSRYKFRVKAVRQLDESIVEIELSCDEQRFDYRPGQFLFISFFQDGLSKEVHPFSISSAPTDNGLRLAIKSLGDYTSQLGKLKLGTLAKVEGPFGRFSLERAGSKKQIWLAGGIGITPFLSMARSLVESEGYDISLFYCVKNETEAVFIAELMQIASGNPQLKVIPFCSDQVGRISAEKIANQVDLQDADLFVCGPPPMMKSLKTQFRKLGIEESRIHSEEFGLL